MARLDVVLDVETIGPPWTDLDESTREYLAVRAYRDEWQRLDADRRDAIIRDGDERVDRTALELGLCEVIAVGLWLVKEDRGLAFVRAADADAEPYEAVCGLGPYVVAPERHVLAETWRKLAQCGTRGSGLRLVTFRGRRFDLPVLGIRSAQLGLKPTVNPAPYRYDVSDHCDLADILDFQGAAGSGYTLAYWCDRFNIENPKAEGVDGGNVGEHWRRGELDVVATYVLRDVRAEAGLFRRLAPTLIAHLRGGAGVDVGTAVPAGV